MVTVQLTEKDEMYADGSLALLLRLCCWATAPLRARRVRAGWRFDASPPLAAVQAVAMTILNVAILTCVILDFCKEPKKRLRVGADALTTVIWISEVAVVMGIASLTVYSGPAQVESLKRVLSQLQQIKLDLHLSNSSPKTENIKSILTVVILIWVVAIMIMDFIYYYSESSKNGTTCILCLHVSFYVGKLVCCVTVLRWALTVELVHDAAAAVNNRLQSLRFVKPTMSMEKLLSKPRSIGSRIAWISGSGATQPVTHLGTGNSTYPPQVKVMIRRLVLSHERIGDVIRQMNKTNGFVLMVVLTAVFMKLVVTPHYMLIYLRTGNSTYPPQVKVMIRRLVLSHERIGDVIRQMNKTNGFVLMVVLTAVFMKLVVTPHYMLIYLLNEDSDVFFDVALSLNWSLSFMAILILTIEPCHRTHLQRELTERLLRQLVLERRQLSEELERFTKHVMLNSPRFMPLGIYSLDRPLMAMILSGATTYLIIIIQFQALSHHIKI